jgi:hypothetical protein
VPERCPLSISIPNGPMVNANVYSCTLGTCADFCQAVAAGPWTGRTPAGAFCP